METILELYKRQKKEGFNKLSKDDLNILKKYYSDSIKYRQGLDRLATAFDLEKINKILDN